MPGRRGDEGPGPSPPQRVDRDQVAEVRTAIAGLRPLQDVRVHRPERRLRTVTEAVGERPDNPRLEVDPRVRGEDARAVLFGDLVEPVAQDVGLDAAGDQRDLRAL